MKIILAEYFDFTDKNLINHKFILKKKSLKFYFYCNYFVNMSQTCDFYVWIIAILEKNSKSNAKEIVLVS